MMAAALLVVGLAACGGYDKHPFKDISEVFLNAAQEVKDNPSIVEDEDYGKNLEDKMNSLAKDLYGKTILTEISEGLGLEVVSNEGRIGEGEIHGDNLHIPINIDLKSIDSSAAYENFNELKAYFYDDEGVAVYYESLGMVQQLKAGQEVEEPDTMSLASAVKVGNILHQGIHIRIEFSEIQPFVNISKIVIEKYDEAKSETIEARNREQEKEFIRKMREAVK